MNCRALTCLVLTALAGLLLPVAMLRAQDAVPATTAEKADDKKSEDKPADEAKPEAKKTEEPKKEEPKPAVAKPEEKKAEEPKADEKAPPSNGPLPGHSLHAEVFNEGPRQKAYLMPGMPKITFAVTSKNPEAIAFVHQGIGQIHGFWYYEAERSFRQAAALDKDCAIAYWGMALANMDNRDRGKKFMAECIKRKANAGEHEVMYIDALDAYLKAENNKKKERNEAYTKALEKILYKYPDDLEARSLLALQLWKNRDSGMPISSFLAIDALLDQVFHANPMHPAHHYRIHLWDYERHENALKSAALCGQTSPGIAHMWHMPGHIYSKARRYDDACFQQEASARTDHAHMMRDRVLPDQIHNFAHNNEWLIRNLIHTGRARDAVELAKNMTSLPRHPKFNTLEKSGSAQLGRARLWDSLAKFELWDELLALTETPYLDATEKEAEQQKRLRHIGHALYRQGEIAQADALLAQLQQQLDDLLEDQTAAATKAETKAKDDKKSAADVKKAVDAAKKTFDAKLTPLKKVVDELQGHQAVAGGDFKKGHELLKKVGNQDAGYLAWLQFKAGSVDEAIKAAQANVTARKNEVLPLLMLTEIQFLAGKQGDARKTFDELREISGQIDLSAPVFQRFAPIAKELGQAGDWRMVKQPKPDTGNRPTLNSLGPFRWAPSPALDWQLVDSAGKKHSLVDYRGKPVIVLFFLGHGCLHCAEQIKEFGKAHSQFAAAGIEIVAISSDDQAGLKSSIENYTDGPIPFPLLADSNLATFQSYRCFDDFEKLPLHGTFLVDGQGLVRWQDISFEPFKDTKFLLGESKRLLNQTMGSAEPKPVTNPMAAVERAAAAESGACEGVAAPYQSVGFVEFPKEVELGAVSAVAIGKNDEIYILQRGEVPLLAFDKDGKYLRGWGQGLFKVPHGLRIDKEGHIWTTDNGNHVLRQFNREGRLLLTFGQEGKGVGGELGFKSPDDLVIDSAGNFYVADAGNGRIVKLSPEGKYLTAWGKKGKGEGEFATAHGLAIDGKDRIYVADRGNKRVQIFDNAGKYVDSWTFGGNPFGLIVIGDELIATDGDVHKIYHLDPAGKTIASWGDPKTLLLPHLMDRDSRGRLYVSEVNGKRVQIFERK
ncbi:Serine/threonine-protein kinase PknD [Anatilimnocola aggregata]|uniref:Serine/threonine-protein kinase PknD n=1 Tax=Anatilimnocola aggregata TaxID=2528021 RepID=A0A517Y783_9BACT|nr:redoxin domain-containing protein [Anatilimnocola aggregata]QDU26075.1 Serine/threonine-protein kinase PknD [Anatilimnocola aggregata]